MLLGPGHVMLCYAVCAEEGSSKFSVLAVWAESTWSPTSSHTSTEPHVQWNFELSFRLFLCTNSANSNHTERVTRQSVDFISIFNSHCFVISSVCPLALTVLLHMFSINSSFCLPLFLDTMEMSTSRATEKKDKMDVSGFGILPKKPSPSELRGNGFKTLLRCRGWI